MEITQRSPKFSNHVGCLKFLAQAVPKKCQQEEEGRPEASRFQTSKLSDPTTDRPGLRDLSGKVQDLTPEPCLARPQSSRVGCLGSGSQWPQPSPGTNNTYMPGNQERK